MYFFSDSLNERLIARNHAWVYFKAMLLRRFSPWFSPVLNALCTVTTAARFLFLQMFGSLPTTGETKICPRGLISPQGFLCMPKFEKFAC